MTHEEMRRQGLAGGVSASAKYAELEARGEERPRCECHGEKMAWAKAPRHPQGGRWRCAEAQRQARLRYAQSEKSLERNRRYNQSAKGRETRRRYNQSA